ncbi:MAG: hypothetical protein ACD_20C00342G0005 [uncultured bacterium]|nr:MAG: hypothetical protein ACD_20C00342G0005 [uncultured bacterium]HBH17738.1 hypothetical protein [Cyanobacteria bacterium UBA9579]
MSILENNIAGIKEYNPILADKIYKHAFNAEARFELTAAESGDPILVYNGTPLHDIKDPQQEALNVFERFQNTSESINIIVGLGLGYLFKRYCLSAKGKIIVYEPNLDILRFTLEAVDFSNELNENRIRIANTRVELMKSLEELFMHKDSLNISGLNSSNILYPQEISSLKEDFPQVVNHLEANYTTLFEKSIWWTLQGIQNIPIIADGYNVDALRNKFKSKPAVIVSSGPSLDKTAQYLAQYRDRVIIFSAANAYKTLVKYGIKPDFITFIEVGDTSPQVKGLDISDINLIALAVANTNLHKLDFKRKFTFYSNNDLFSRWISKTAGFSVEDYENKGTVSYCALFSALMMGCNPIILVGQDLAYSGDKCYSADSAYGAIRLVKDQLTGQYEVELENIEEFKKHIAANATDEVIAEIIKSKLEPIKANIAFVRGQNGEMLTTDANYAGFIQYFESFAYEHPDLELINSSTGGAQIDGFKNVELKEILEKCAPLNANVDSAIDQMLLNYNEPVKEHLNEVAAQIKCILKDIDEFMPLAQDGLDKANQLLEELKKTSFDIDKIRILAGSLMQYYIKLQGELFDKHQILASCIFKELLTLTKIMESDSAGNLEDLTNMAQASVDFYGVFPGRMSTFKTIAENTLNNLSDHTLA